MFVKLYVKFQNDVNIWTFDFLASKHIELLKMSCHFVNKGSVWKYLCTCFCFSLFCFGSAIISYWILIYLPIFFSIVWLKHIYLFISIGEKSETISMAQCKRGIAPWASYQIRKIAGCACAGNAGNVFPRRRFQRKPLVSDPGMHHGTCVTHVPWCMSGSLTCGDGENVPGIPGACAPAILRIWQEAHCISIGVTSLFNEAPFRGECFVSTGAVAM